MNNKKRSSDLKAIPGHRNYYRSSSGIIYYKDAQLGKFSTGETTISRARKVVEKKKLEAGGKTEAMSKRSIMGVSNPMLSVLWGEMLAEISNDVIHSTLGNYNKDWKIVLSKFWGEKFVYDLNDKNFIEFKSWYLENHKGRYARKTIVHFKKFCKWLQKKGFVRSLPDFSLLTAIHETTEKFAKREKVGRVYDEDSEIKPILAAAKKISSKESICAMTTLGILLGVRCGLRKMEAMKLKWENIDMKKKIIRVWSQKNHKWRSVPIIDEVMAALTVQSVFTALGSTWVFPKFSNSKEHVSSQIFDKYWIRAKKAAKIGGRARFHDLRHTFATLTAEKGWPPVVACEVLDQSLDVYQKIYCHPSEESIAAMMARTFNKNNENKEEL